MISGAEPQLSPQQILSRIPIFHILDDKVQDLGELVSRFQKPKKEDVHKLLYETPNLEFPDLDQIDPRRATKLIIGSEARWVKQITHSWLEREKMLYPPDVT